VKFGKLTTLSALLTATLVVTGCGTSDKDAEPLAATDAGSGTEEGAEEGADAGPPAEKTACTLVAPADLEALFTAPAEFKYQESQPDDSNSRTCVWDETTSGSLMSLTAETPTNGADREYDASWRRDSKRHPTESRAEEVAGLGDKAHSASSKGRVQVKVLVGDTFVTVDVWYAIGKPPPKDITAGADVARVVTFTKQVVGRLAATKPAEPAATKPAAPDACDLLPLAEIKKLTGLVAAIRTDLPDNCYWNVPNPTDNLHNALAINVSWHESAEKAKEAFPAFVDERVAGIGEDASISTSGTPELRVLVGSRMITITSQNQAVDRDVLREIGRSVARNAG
jgi:hypothetical protein